MYISKAEYLVKGLIDSMKEGTESNYAEIQANLHTVEEVREFQKIYELEFALMTAQNLIKTKALLEQTVAKFLLSTVQT